MKKNFDNRHRAQNLPHLVKGDNVYIPDTQQEGVIKDSHATRSYMVETPKGIIRRNRKHLNLMPSQHQTAEIGEEENKEYSDTVETSSPRATATPDPPSGPLGFHCNVHDVANE